MRNPVNARILRVFGPAAMDLICVRELPTDFGVERHRLETARILKEAVNPHRHALRTRIQVGRTHWKT